MLNKIVEKKKNSINRKKSLNPVFSMKNIARTYQNRSLVERIKRMGFVVIAETKKASPSGGIFRKRYNPSRIAISYVRGGASAISVLTEENFFLGSIDHLKAVKNVVDVPVVAKDFVIDEYQIYEARYAGADCILLILRILSDKQFLHLFNVAQSLDLEILIEVHDSGELQRFFNILPNSKKVLLGINSRDLDNLNIDYNRLFGLLSSVKNIKIPIIAESGINNSKMLKKLYQQGASGVLIGEYLLRSKSPSLAVKKLLKEIDDARNKD